MDTPKPRTQVVAWRRFQAQEIEGDRSTTGRRRSGGLTQPGSGRGPSRHQHLACYGARMFARVVAAVAWLGSLGVLVGCSDDPAQSDPDVQPDAGTAATPCPTEPPADGTSCANSGPCSYLRCGGEGLVTGVCNSETWTVTTTPCAEHECSGETCSATQLCHDQSSGAQMGTCVDNPCDDGPVTCDCLVAICGDSPGCSVTDARTFRCSAPCEGCP